MVENRNTNGSRRRALVALVAIVFLGVIGWVLTHFLSQSARMQDCLFSGRRNCSPVDQSR
jgi:hypothetical protein